VAELGTWERAGDLEKLVTLAVVSRPPTPSPQGAQAPPTPAGPDAPPGWRLERVDGPRVDVSSSAVRQVLNRGGSIDELVPAGVVRCIRQRNLYAVGR
jgi:nicotinic acid mononucleotide adenylyltransferase